MSFIISTLFMMVATDVSQFEGHNAHVFECGSKDVCKFILNIFLNI